MPTRWLRERCPRCNGSVYVEENFYTARLESICLLCGRGRELARLRTPPAVPEVEWLRAVGG